MMVMAAEPDVSTSERRLGSEYEALVQQAMAVPEIARAMEAYAELQHCQGTVPAPVRKVMYATGGNASAISPTNAPMIPFGVGGNR